MRRAFLERHNLTYDEALRLGEDYVLYAEAMIRGAVLVVVKDCGYVAVEHAHSLSGSHGADDLAALAKADGRLLALAAADAELHREILQHSRITGWKVDYRRMLDAKRQKRFPAMFGYLFRTPTTAAYILGQTCRAWTAPLA
jgi:succinoglycan biosynthesis protein ExoU